MSTAWKFSSRTVEWLGCEAEKETSIAAASDCTIDKFFFLDRAHHSYRGIPADTTLG